MMLMTCDTKFDIKTEQTGPKLPENNAERASTKIVFA